MWRGDDSSPTCAAEVVREAVYGVGNQSASVKRSMLLHPTQHSGKEIKSLCFQKSPEGASAHGLKVSANSDTALL